jgi:hypothetical protein
MRSPTSPARSPTWLLRRLYRSRRALSTWVASRRIWACRRWCCSIAPQTELHRARHDPDPALHLSCALRARQPQPSVGAVSRRRLFRHDRIKVDAWIRQWGKGKFGRFRFSGWTRVLFCRRAARAVHFDSTVVIEQRRPHAACGLPAQAGARAT